MFTSKSLKVGFISLFASLALLLAMFTSTGIASAHTTSSQSVDGHHRHCRLLILETVTFVPFNNFGFNTWNPNNQWNNGWNNNNPWGFQQNQNMSFWQNNNWDNNQWDNNQWDFDHFNGFGQNNINGFFIVRVTEIRVCNGHHNGQHSFEFRED
jgi:hypothetical protein